MGDGSKSNSTTGLVSSGTGASVVRLTDVPASQYARVTLNPDVASLLDTNTTLTYTRAANISKTQLNDADRDLTTAMNVLSGYHSRDDRSSVGYQQAKVDVMDAEGRWQLARDNLERVTVRDRALTSEYTPTGNLDNILDGITAEDHVDLDLSADSITPDLSATTSEDDPPSGDDIVVTGIKTDERIRLRPKLREGSLFPILGDKDSILYLLNDTNGVFFPFTPTISMNHRATYSTMSPTHSNTDYMVYTNTPAVQISIQGQFSSQNLPEARYTLAAMHFFRTVTKMRFGETDDNRGLPPPILVLSGYGEFMFNDLDVIVTDFSMDLPANVDYLEVDNNGILAWVPSLTTFNVSCVVQQTPRQQREDFNLDQFASGALFKDGKRGWI